MSMFKRTLCAALRPCALLFDALSGVRRLWAYARLSAGTRDFIDASVVVLGAPEIHGTGRISVGRNAFLYREIYLETQDRGNIEIAEDVVISRGAHLVAFAGIHIGRGAMIGEYAGIRDANHRFGPGLALRDSGHIARPIHIGNNVWIGRGATVLGGVTIGDNAVVGANAVVTRDVSPGAVVAGVPARPLPAKVAS